MSQGFDIFYSRHAPYVRRVLARYGVRPGDLDDAVQEVFVVAHRRLHEFEGRSKPETWLHAICFRTAAGLRRRAHRRLEQPEREDEAGGGVAPAAEDGVALEHTFRALDIMDEDDRELWALSEIGGLSAAELSRLTGLARATVQARLKRARRAMQRRPRANATARAEASAPHQAGAAVARGTTDSPDYLDAACCVSTLDETLLTVWRGQPSPSRLDEIARAGRHVLEHQGTLSYFCVIESSSTPPDRHCRRTNEALIRSLLCQARGAAFVIEGSKLFRFVVAFTNAYLFLVRSPTRVRYFLRPPDAAFWLAGGEGNAAEAGRLLARLEGMKEQLDRLEQGEHAS